jgi:hypothetical protein
MLIAAAAGLATVTLAAGIVVGLGLGRHTPLSHEPVSAALKSDFAQLQTRLHAEVGIAVGAVSDPQTSMTLGELQTGPAWSTIKVPLIIAALREKRPPEVTEAMTAAITESDNGAAESIWAGLGDPGTAARKVDAVLREAGDPTTVQSQRVRPEFSAFGQTQWPLLQQVRFLSVAFCDTANTPVFDLMGRVQQDQSWGVGTLPESRFKGGWGPSPDGRYLVRQMGVLIGPTGMLAVALAAQPASGRFDDGVAALTQISGWLAAHLSSLPAGHCSH